MKTKFLKISAGFLTLIILASQVLISPPKARAIAAAPLSVPTFETNPVVVTAVSSETSQTFFEWAQTFVLETLKKRILDMMVDQIVVWIQGGGKPKFITNWGDFLAEAGNAAVGDLAKELGLGFLCSPFSLQIQIGLLPVQRFSKRASCTLDKIVSNINGFYANFRNGGWIAYSSAWEPQNNFAGASLIVDAEVARRREKAESSAYAEAQAGHGFLSTKKCDKDKNGKDIASTCVITTPGDTIGNLVSKAVGSDIDYILSAKQLSQYVAAISNALINRLIIEGVNGLRGLTTAAAPQGGVIPRSATGNCAGLRGGSLNACLSYGSSNNLNATSTLITQINLSLNPRLEAQNSFTNSISQLQSYAQSLQGFLNTLNTSSCPLQSLRVQNVQTEISWTSSTITDLQNQKNTNQTTIDNLNRLLAQVRALPPNSWQQISDLSVQLNSQLNAADAQTVLQGAQSQSNDISSRISQNTQTLGQSATLCSLGQ